jgi:hypothetical protein
MRLFKLLWQRLLHLASVNVLFLSLVGSWFLIYRDEEYIELKKQIEQMNNKINKQKIPQTQVI